MQKNFTLIVFFALSLSLSAQPIFTSAYLPSAGKSFKVFYLDANYEAQLKTGSAGSNQTWDFSNAVGDKTNPLAIKFLNVPTSGVPAEFSSATLLEQQTDKSGVSNVYAKITSIGVYAIGLNNVQSKIVFSPAEHTLITPMTYGMIAKDTFTQTSTTSGNSVIQNVIHTLTYDGYGTVKTPVGSFSCLRLRDSLYSVITVGGISIPVVTIGYAWYAPDFKFPVFEFTYIYYPASPDQKSYIGYYLSAETTPTQDIAVNNFSSLYPNPAKNAAFMDFKLENADKISIHILNLLGQEVSSESLNDLFSGEQHHALDIQNLSTGLYIVSVRGITGELFNKKLFVGK